MRRNGGPWALGTARLTACAARSASLSDRPPQGELHDPNRTPPWRMGRAARCRQRRQRTAGRRPRGSSATAGIGLLRLPAGAGRPAVPGRTPLGAQHRGAHRPSRAVRFRPPRQQPRHVGRELPRHRHHALRLGQQRAPGIQRHRPASRQRRKLPRGPWSVQRPIRRLRAARLGQPLGRADRHHGLGTRPSLALEPPAVVRARTLGRRPLGRSAGRRAGGRRRRVAGGAALLAERAHWPHAQRQGRCTRQRRGGLVVQQRWRSPGGPGAGR